MLRGGVARALDRALTLLRRRAPFPRPADDAFTDKQQGFLEKHCAVFDEGDDNKLEYTQLHAEYTDLIETALAEALAGAGHSMEELQALLETRDEGELVGDVFDMLMSFSDFGAFKEIMLDTKRAQANPFGDGLAVGAANLHHDEVTDGEEMPDLNLSISSPLADKKGHFDE